MKIFFDCEFTGLHQHTTLISLGCVAEDGREFYAEFGDYDKSQINQWLADNVLKHLFLMDQTQKIDWPHVLAEGNSWSVLGYRRHVASVFSDWIKQFDQVEMWSDVLAYDWMLFCELFEAEDTAERLPRNIYYIPFDIATLMKVKGIDPDISREDFSGISNLAKHNALDDARIIKACYEKLMSL